MEQNQEYMQDSQGRLVPKQNVKEIDLLRDELVLELAKKFEALQADLSAHKLNFLSEIEAFVELSADKYGIKLGGSKGNVTLTSYAGEYKITRAIAETITFDERLQAAQTLIRQCMRDWTEGQNSNLVALVDNAFEVNKEGNVSTTRILSLRRINIDDERWKTAMQAISDSVQVVASKAYVRLYKRDNTGRYLPISLDFSVL